MAEQSLRGQFADRPVDDTDGYTRSTGTFGRSDRRVAALGATVRELDQRAGGEPPGGRE